MQTGLACIRAMCSVRRVCLHPYGSPEPHKCSGRDSFVYCKLELLINFATCTRCFGGELRVHISSPVFLLLRSDGVSVYELSDPVMYCGDIFQGSTVVE